MCKKKVVFSSKIFSKGWKVWDCDINSFTHLFWFCFPFCDYHRSWIDSSILILQVSMICSPLIFSFDFNDLINFLMLGVNDNRILNSLWHQMTYKKFEIRSMFYFHSHRTIKILFTRACFCLCSNFEFFISILYDDVYSIILLMNLFFLWILEFCFRCWIPSLFSPL